MRRITILALALLAAPLAAQQQQATAQMVKVKRSGLPDGWTLRLDDKERRYGVDDTKFVTMGSGLHVTSGPAAIYYHESAKVTGNHTVSATFAQRKAPQHAEAYGLFVGGRKLDTAEQEYLYFLVRKDGKYLVAHRAGADVHKIVDWTEHSAVRKEDASGAQTNTLAIEVSAGGVTLMANGERVTSFTRDEMKGMVPVGYAGLRVNHGLDLHISNYEVKK